MMRQKPAATAASGSSNCACDDEEDTPSCWICLDDGSEEPLRRECACRGAAGWAHLSCLSDYATTKNRDLLKSFEQNPLTTELGNLLNFGVVWCQCFNCKQYHGESLNLDLSREFVERTGNDYRENDLIRTQAQFQLAKALVADSNRGNRPQKMLKRLISLIKTRGISFPESVLAVSPDAPQAFSDEIIICCLISLGGICREQKDYLKALDAFEEARTMLEESGKVHRLKYMDYLIAGVTEDMGAEPTEKEARQRIEVLRKHIAELDKLFGPNHAGISRKRYELACYLSHLGDKECVECFEILEDMVQRCRAVFGADHPETKRR